MEGKISSNLNDMERKKMGLQKAILSLLVEWKEFEDHLDSSTNSTSEEPSNQLAQESRQGKSKVGLSLEKNQVEISQNPMHEKLKVVNLSDGAFENRAQLLEIEEGKLKEKWESLVSKEKEMGRVQVLCEEKLKEIESKEREMEFSRKFIEERAKELELKQKELDEGFRELELKKIELTENTYKISGGNCSNGDMACSKSSRQEPTPNLESPRELRSQTHELRKSGTVQNKIPNISGSLVTNSKHQEQPAQQDMQDSRQTFGTECPFCSTKCQYNKDCYNKGLCYPSCSKKCIVYDSSHHNAVPQANKGKSDALNEMSCSSQDQRVFSRQKKVPKWEAAKLGALSTEGFLPSTVENEENRSQVLKGSEQTLKEKDHALVDAGLKTKTKEDGLASLDDILLPTCNGKTRQLRKLRNTKRKRGNKTVAGWGRSYYDAKSGSSGSDPNENGGCVLVKQTRATDKASQKQCISGDGHKSDKDGFVSPPKKHKTTRSHCDVLEDREQELVGDMELESVEPEFSNFIEDKEEKRFAVDQIWACYDCVDAMPRFYAKVIKVSSPEEVQVSWLEPDLKDQNEIDWVKTGLPVACGRFSSTSSEENQENLSRLCFSHQIHYKKLNLSSYLIYPRRGETWAIFKNWDINWMFDPKNHEQFQFEIVEILSDFNRKTGIKVAYLERTNGFVSLFRRTKGAIPLVRIPSSELLKFSHQVPSFRMSGSERNGVPTGCFKLDPDALAAAPASPTVMCSNEKVNMRTTINDMKLKRSSTGQENLTTDVEKRKTTTDLVDIELIVDPEMETSKFQRSRTDSSKKRASSDVSHVNFSERLTTSQSMSTSVLVPREVFHDFSKDKSIEKFKPGQVWALYSGLNDISKSYVQIKEVESALLMVHATFLKLTQPEPVRCGMFIVGKEEPNIFFPRSFSHEVKTKPCSGNKHVICPWKGEIWAMYISRNDKSVSLGTKDCEYDIVEILKCNKEGIEVSSLIRRAGFKSIFMVPSKLGSNRDVVKFRWSEISRFSHRIPAFQLTGEYGGQLADYLELDPLAIPGNITN